MLQKLPAGEVVNKVNMNLSEVAHYLKQKLKIKRSSWDKEIYVLYDFTTESMTYYDANDHKVEFWSPNLPTLLANDWEIITSED
jgi:hypothetical protein